MRKPRIQISWAMAVEMGPVGLEVMKANIVKTCGGKWIHHPQRDALVLVGGKR